MAANSFFSFGSGDLIAVPQGSIGTAFPTPVRFGTVQGVDVEFSAGMKELFGKNRFPVAVASTEMKITGKAKSAQIIAPLWNVVFFGNATVGVGESNKTVINEAQTPSTGTFTVTNSANFVADLGVFDTVTGLYMTKITSGSPTSGQYKVAAGVYTVFASDTNPKLVCYTYSTTTAGQGNFKIPNIAMGSNPQFSMYLSNSQWQGIELNLELYQCSASKLTLGWKNNDWMVPEFDFYAMDNGTGNVGEFSYDQAN